MEALDSLPALIQRAIEEQTNSIRGQFVEELRSRQDAFDKETHQLREEIQALKQQEHGNHTITSKTTPEISPGKHQDLKDELAECKETYERAMYANELLQNRVRKMKADQRIWKRYYNSRILKDTKPSVHSPSARSISAPAPPTYPKGTSLFSRSLTSTSFSSDTASRPESNDLQGKGTGSLRADAPSCQSSKGDEETEDDTDGMSATAGRNSKFLQLMPPPATQIKDEPNANTSSPIVVTERSLKRKASSKASEGADSSAGGASASEKRIKKEDIPSSPLQPLDCTNHLGDVTESLDLDEVGGTLRTPRKRLRSMGLMRRLNLAGIEEPRLHLHHAIDKDYQGNGNTDKSAQKFDKNLDPKSTGAPTTESKHSVESGVVQPSQWVALPVPKADRPGQLPLATPAAEDTNNGHPKVQKQKDIFDVPSSSPTDKAQTHQGICTTSSTRRRRPPRSDHGVAVIPFVTEDGESVPRSQEGSRGGRKSGDPPSRGAIRSDSFDSRLGRLLSGPSSPKPSIQLDTPSTMMRKVSDRRTTIQGIRPLHTPKSAPSAAMSKAFVPRSPKSLPPASRPGRPAVRPNQTKYRTPNTSSRNLNDDPDRLVQARRTPHQPTASSFSNSPAPINPDSEPLRTRPLSTLKLTDFRPNPSYADVPHAHHESLRRHDEKADRTGCSDPFCSRCASLTAFAHSTLASLPPLSPISETKLLRSYLGPSAPFPTEGTERRRELVEKARVQEFKDRYGKHRQTFSRAVEPPGFWDADFPDTQREEELADMAGEVERRKVEERWREAMRGDVGVGGGRNGKGPMWLFADEVDRGRRRK